MNFAELIWGGFNGSYALPEDEIHVWRTTLDMEPSGFTKLQQILSPDERGRANRFHFEVDRRRGVIGRGYLRLLLGRILDLPANKLQFEYDEFGKPSLIPKQRPPLQFNVSHSGGMILIAITIGREVGVDVERIRTDLDPVIIAARFFSAIEYKILTSLAGPARYEAFFACWTRKEAYLKARGVGLSLPLDQFDVSFLPEEEPRLLATRPDPAEARRWRIQALDLSGDYAAALAAPGSTWKLKCWNWNPLLVVDGPEKSI
jgi:4'-phosphopantetheinyl transferase